MKANVDNSSRRLPWYDALAFFGRAFSRIRSDDPGQAGSSCLQRVCCKINKTALILVGTGLLVFALLKFTSLFFDQAQATLSFYSSPNPIFAPLTNRVVHSVAAMAECLVAMAFITKTPRLLATSLLTWITITFLGYRYALNSLNIGGGCSCGGASANDAVPMETFATALLVAMLVTAAFGWFLEVLQRTRGKTKVNALHDNPVSRGDAVALRGRVVTLVLVMGWLQGAPLQTSETKPSVSFLVEASFHITYQITNSAGSKPEDLMFDATCAYSDGLWRIDTYHAKNARRTYYYDGTNVYTLTSILYPPPDELITNIGNRHGRTFDHSSDEISLRITPGPLPLGGVTVSLPWLVFCSGEYLKSSEQILPVFGFDPTVTLDAFSHELHLEVFEDALGLPKSVNWLFDRGRLLRSVRTKEMRRGRDILDDYMKLKQASSHITAKYVRESYTTQSHTNVNGWILPAVFEMRHFVPLRDETTREVYKATGAIKRLALKTKNWGAVELGIGLSTNATYRVADYRFRSEKHLVDSISYPINDGVLKPTTDPALVEQFAHAVSKAEPDPFVRARFLRTMGFIVVGFPVMCAAAYGIFRLRKMRNINN